MEASRRGAAAVTTRLGDWILDEVVGRGSVSVVHAAHHHADAGVVVAVKRLASAAPATVATLRREATTLAELAHPAIMPLRELVADGDGVALVMPLATGGSLATRLRADGALHWREAADLGARVAGALAVAHDAGVLHRDVTPGNILYGAEDEPRLADFGVALVREDDEQVVGTPGYLDPVVATGSPPGPSSDVYGLGVVLYEALAGQPPFAGVTPASVVRSADRGDHLPLASLAPDTPPELAALVEQAMDRDPARRPASAQRLQVELEHLLQASDVQGHHEADGQPDDVDEARPAGGAAAHGVSVGEARDVGPGDVVRGDQRDGTTTVFGPRPPVRLSVAAQRPAWVVAALAALLALPLAATAWLGWRAWSQGGPALGATAPPSASGPDTPHAATAASSPPATRSPVPGEESPSVPTPAPLERTPAAGTATAPTEPARVARTPSPACDAGSGGDALVDVDGRGCSLAVGVAERDVDGDRVVVVSVPAAAGRLAGDYALPGPPRAVVFGDWDCDGAETPAVVVGSEGRVWGFEGFGALEASELDEPVGAATPVVVTDAAGCDHVVPSG